MLKPRIMVVEDERIESLALQDSLGRLGYSVTAVATSGTEAVRLAEEALPDLVLMDIKISGTMDGIEAAKAIQAVRDIPVVYISALSDRETLRRALHSSPFGYLVKPFDEDELRTTVEIALYKHRIQLELKMAKEAAQAATMTKGDFLARMDTNLVTPMHGILGLAELALSDKQQPEQHEQVESIKRSTRSLVSTLSETLGFCGARNDDFSLRFGLDSLLEPLAVHAQSKGLRLEWSVEPDVPDLLRGDEDTLLQALRNIAVTAVKFTRQGSVTVRVGRVDPSAGPASPDPTGLAGSGHPAHPVHRPPTADGLTLLFEVRSSATPFSIDAIDSIGEDKREAISAPSNAPAQGGEPAPRPHSSTSLGLPQARELIRRLDGSILPPRDQGNIFSFIVTLKSV